METAGLINHLTQALFLTLWLSLPPIIVTSVVGTLFSLFQALTQVQEQTLSFAIKLVAVMITLALTASWVGVEIFNFTVAVFDAMPQLKR